MPGKIATQWFLEEEISLATSISVSGWLVGCALGYVVPPIVLSGPTFPDEFADNENSVFSTQNASNSNSRDREWNANDFKIVENQLIALQSTIAGVCLILTVVLMIIYNKDKIGAPNIAESR